MLKVTRKERIHAAIMTVIAILGAVAYLALFVLCPTTILGWVTRAASVGMALFLAGLSTEPLYIARTGRKSAWDRDPYIRAAERRKRWGG